jgi:hypothetical protein
MRKISLSFAVILSVILLTTGALLAVDPAYLPADLKIVPPDKNVVPEKLAEFSGIWEGHWTYLQNRTQFATFAVEKIGKNRALVTYGWGPLESGPRGGVTKDPGWKRVPGCPVEKAEDGNYIITVTLKESTYILKQTDKKDTIMITQKKGAGMSQDLTQPFSRKK